MQKKQTGVDESETTTVEVKARDRVDADVIDELLKTDMASRREIKGLKRLFGSASAGWKFVR